MATEPTDYEILHAMLTYGGAFVSRLAALYGHADPENQAILKTAFAHYWAEYRDLSAREGPPRCPRCGSYAWVYKGDRQVCADCGR